MLPSNKRLSYLVKQTTRKNYFPTVSLKIKHNTIHKCGKNEKKIDKLDFNTIEAGFAFSISKQETRSTQKGKMVKNRSQS